jgi:hypothetical protein
MRYRDAHRYEPLGLYLHALIILFVAGVVYTASRRIHFQIVGVVSSG